jgi:radical SAM family protein/4Fe-4S single cluster protein
MVSGRRDKTDLYMADGEPVARVQPNAARLEKFQHPDITADGAARAEVAFDRLETLWVNTGTLCNVECAHCYIKSSPSNDSLVYLTADELAPFLDEARAMGAHTVGFTGGEPFMNPQMLAMAAAALGHGFEVLILTNAMRPMVREQMKAGLVALREEHGARLKLRVSLDHFLPARHDLERGAGSFDVGMEGLCWLAANGFSISLAGRTLWGESEDEMRAGFAKLFQAHGLSLDANDPADLIFFPEMDEAAPVPEITTDCWDVLGKDPRQIMCASARMIVKRKAAPAPVVLACTLIAYDKAFEVGASLDEAARPVKLNHPHCAKFCVLGGARCSG